MYVQVSDNIAGEDTFKREAVPFLSIRDAYPKKVLFVIICAIIFKENATIVLNCCIFFYTIYIEPNEKYLTVKMKKIRFYLLRYSSRAARIRYFYNNI